MNYIQHKSHYIKDDKTSQVNLKSELFGRKYYAFSGIIVVFFNAIKH